MTEEGPKTESESPKEAPKPISIPFAIVICVIWTTCAGLTYLLFTSFSPWLSELWNIVASGGNDNTHMTVVAATGVCMLITIMLPVFIGSSIAAGALAGRR